MDRTALLSDLAGILPSERLITDPAELFVYEADGFTIAKARPAAVCFPINTAEVAQVMKTIAKHDTQIVLSAAAALDLPADASRSTWA